jgi:hypothetical protein
VFKSLRVYEFKSSKKQSGISKPLSNYHYFCEQIKTILLRMILYFDVAYKCFEKWIQIKVIRRWIATSKYNANTTDLSG